LKIKLFVKKDFIFSKAIKLKISFRKKAAQKFDCSRAQIDLVEQQTNAVGDILMRQKNFDKKTLLKKNTQSSLDKRIKRE
jgi:hypothetical protein